MRRMEEVYREVLFRRMEKNENEFTQSEVSKKLGISLSIVNSAIKKLEDMGAIKIYQRKFIVLDVKKILYLWASLRNLKKDIVFSARIDAPVREIERILPDIFYTAYTAYKLKFKDVPADYSEVYVYADEKEFKEIEKRISGFEFNKNSINPNFFVLKKDPSMNLYKKTTLAQIFVDLWNLKEWYAKDFINAMEERFDLD